MGKKYLCDPRKNVECTKEGCRWRRKNSGECFCTTKVECAFDQVPDPISDLDYSVLEKDLSFLLITCFGVVADDINKKCFNKED